MKVLKFLSIVLAVLSLSLSAPAIARPFWSPLTDTVNSGIINSKMVASDRLENIHVDATVENGVAIFSGTVNNRAQLDELVNIARSVSGVHGVDVTRLQVGH